MANAKSKTRAQQELRNAIEGDSITLSSMVVKDGVRVPESVTFPIPGIDDLPRSLRRKVKQVQGKYGVPLASDRSGGRIDVFALAFELGELVAAYHGAHLDLDNDEVPAEVADAQDAAITALGMRLIGSQKRDGGVPKEREEEAEEAPTGG